MNAKRPSKATIRDVGARAGVSYQTVSRLLNGTGPVSVAAKQRIEAAIADLGYSPDPTAKNLVTKRSQVIGIITATYEGNACVQTLEGAATGFQDAGYSVVIGGGEQRSRHEPDMLPLLKHQRVAGLLVVYSGSQADTHRLLTEIPPGIPVVTTGYAQDRANVVAVRVQTEDGARAATRHLINLGHRQIAAVTGVPEVFETIQRDNGYRAALDEAGIPYREELIIPGDWFVESGYDATRLLLQRKTPFTAIFAHSDRMAIGCIRALFDHGLGVPNDVAVVGFNDISLARFVSPPLTTVHHPLYELGAVCAGLLMGLIDGRSAPELAAIHERASRLIPQLIIRQSCGAQIAPDGSQISTSNV